MNCCLLLSFCFKHFTRHLNILDLIQDSLAQAVAEEMKKVYKKELDPEPIPLTVPGEPVTEEEVSFHHSILVLLIDTYIT